MPHFQPRMGNTLSGVADGCGCPREGKDRRYMYPDLPEPMSHSEFQSAKSAQIVVIPPTPPETRPLGPVPGLSLISNEELHMDAETEPIMRSEEPPGSVSEAPAGVVEMKHIESDVDREKRVGENWKKGICHVQTITAHKRPGSDCSVRSVAFDEDAIYSGGRDGLVLAHSWGAEPQLLFSLKHPQPVTSLVRVGKYVVTGSTDSNVYVWSARTQELVEVLNKRHMNGVTALTVGTGQRVVSGGGDGSIVVWNSVRWEVLLKVSVSTQAVTSVQLHGQYLVVGTKDGMIRVLDATSGKTQGGISLPAGLFAQSLYCTDDLMLCGAIKVSSSITTPTSQLSTPTSQLSQPSAPSSSTLFLLPPAGTTLSLLKIPVNVSVYCAKLQSGFIICSCANSRVQIWDVEGNCLVSELYAVSPLNQSTVWSFASDTTKMVCGCSDGTVKVFHFDDKDWPALQPPVAS